jgi:hypothetical protein
MDQQIIQTCKDYIECDLLEELQVYVQSLYSLNIQDYRLPWESIYQQVYLHACLKKNVRIAKWIQSIFTKVFDEVQQIGLRQMFAYGNYMLNK